MNWKQILAPVLVFVLGSVCGGGATALYALHKFQQVSSNEPEATAEIGTRRLVRQLGLDAEQRIAAQPVLIAAARELARIRMQSMPEVRAVIENAAEELRPILRPRQQERLDQLLQGPRARWRMNQERQPFRQRLRPGEPPQP